MPAETRTEHAIEIDEALRPEADLAQFQAMLAKYRKYEAVMVIGHNPSLTEFLGKTISAGMSAAHIEFKKGAVAKVETSGRIGMLHWLLTPKIARSLQASRKLSSRPKTSRK